MESPWNGESYEAPEAQLRQQMRCKITFGKTVAGGSRGTVHCSELKLWL